MLRITYIDSNSPIKKLNAVVKALITPTVIEVILLFAKDRKESLTHFIKISLCSLTKLRIKTAVVEVSSARKLLIQYVAASTSLGITSTKPIMLLYSSGITIFKTIQIIKNMVMKENTIPRMRERLLACFWFVKPEVSGLNIFLSKNLTSGLKRYPMIRPKIIGCKTPRKF